MAGESAFAPIRDTALPRRRPAVVHSRQIDWQTIVVGYDGTRASNVALTRAADIAESVGATLVVTSIAQVVPAPYFDPAASPEEHRDELQHARDMLATRRLKTEFALGGGEPADAIVGLAERSGSGLIVVGSHDRGFLDRLLHGSVSAGVLRRAHCDVLIVR